VVSVCCTAKVWTKIYNEFRKVIMTALLECNHKCYTLNLAGTTPSTQRMASTASPSNSPAWFGQDGMQRQGNGTQQPLNSRSAASGSRRPYSGAGGGSRDSSVMHRQESNDTGSFSNGSPNASPNQRPRPRSSFHPQSSKSTEFPASGEIYASGYCLL
jgi:hypothetical protein